jgi:hypothetical protein
MESRFFKNLFHAVSKIVLFHNLISSDFLTLYFSFSLFIPTCPVHRALVHFRDGILMKYLPWLASQSEPPKQLGLQA